MLLLRLSKRKRKTSIDISEHRSTRYNHFTDTFDDEIDQIGFVMGLRRLALVAFENEISWGLRNMAEFLRSRGYGVDLYFLERYSNRPQGVNNRSIDKFLEVFDPGSGDVVGISFMTPHAQYARILGKTLRSTKAVVVAGGIHPTIMPFDCVDYADYVVRGSGEIALEMILRSLRDGLSPAKGIYREDQEFWFNEDLSSFPHPRYGDVPDNVIVNGKHQRIREVPRKLGAVTRYQTFTALGCAYTCTYCVNPNLQELSGRRGKKFLRRRPHQLVIDELKHVKSKIDFVSFEDEDFLLDAEQASTFLEQYKNEISLPFSCLITPSTLKSTNLEQLVEKLRKANCVSITIGLQSASPRSAKLYRRPFELERLIQVAKAFSHNRILVVYDIILDSPFETEKDVEMTVDAVLQLPHPFEVNVFYLTLFPGYKLTEIAKDEGVDVNDFGDTRTRRHSLTIEEAIIRLATMPLIPRRFLRAAFARRGSTVINGLIIGMAKVLVPLWTNRGISSLRLAGLQPGIAFDSLRRRLTAVVNSKAS